MAKDNPGSDSYWEKVSVKDAVRRINLTESYINRSLARYYELAKAEILREVEAFYSKYGKSSGLSPAEAKRKIKAAEFAGIDFEELSRLAAETQDAQLHDLVSRLSKKGQISRLEQLNLRIDAILSRLYDKEQSSVYEYLADTYAYDYYQSIYNIDKFLGVRTAFTVINESVITNAVTHAWSKRRFSKAIWGHRSELSEDLRGVITKHLIKGSGIDKVSAELSKRCDVSFSNAKRLVRTEMNRIHNKSTLDAYKKEAGIERYRFLAILDFKTSTVCKNLDGAILDVNTAQVGVNYPPMHPNCRSTVTPEIEGDFVGKRLAKDADGNYYHVSADMTYNEWYASLPEKTRLKMELERKKARNLYADKKQLESYREAFENSDMPLPKSITGFQRIKYESGEWDKFKSEFRAINADKKQLESFRSVLGGAGLPEGLAEFRNLKYSNSTEFNRLKTAFEDEVKTMKFRHFLSIGEVNLQVRQQKQMEHTLGTHQWQRRTRESIKNGDSPTGAFFQGIDVQLLVNENAGKGIIEFRKNDAYPREYFDTNDFVGVAYDKIDGKYKITNRIAIHYSSKGTHAYPVQQKEGQHE